MSDDFSAQSHYVGGKEGGKPSTGGDPEIFKQLDNALTILEGMTIPDVEIAEVQQVFDEIFKTVATMRAILERAKKPNWKPWRIGGRVIIRGGPYDGQEGKLLGMVDTPHGQQANVDLGGFTVEVGVGWLEGL